MHARREIRVLALGLSIVLVALAVPIGSLQRGQLPPCTDLVLRTHLIGQILRAEIAVGRRRRRELMPARQVDGDCGEVARVASEPGRHRQRDGSGKPRLASRRTQHGWNVIQIVMPT